MHKSIKTSLQIFLSLTEFAEGLLAELWDVTIGLKPASPVKLGFEHKKNILLTKPTYNFISTMLFSTNQDK